MMSQILLACLLTTSVFLISIGTTNSSPVALVKFDGKVTTEKSELLKLDVFLVETKKARREQNTREKRGAKDKVEKVVKKVEEAVRQRATKENGKKVAKKIVEAARKKPEKTKKILKKIGKLGSGKIAGIVIGVIALIAIIGVAYYFCKKQQQQQ